ncbi:hypothetical protein PET01_06150 [Pediococcus ethanolidurans]|nr:hypothetical protein PET01_06150 [Pediococcus ethanolidurans]
MSINKIVAKITNGNKFIGANMIAIKLPTNNGDSKIAELTPIATMTITKVRSKFGSS